MDISEKTNKIEIIEEKTTFLMIDIEESVPKTIEYLKDLDEDLRPYFSLYVPQEDNPLFTNEDFLDKKKRQEVSSFLPVKTSTESACSRDSLRTEFLLSVLQICYLYRIRLYGYKI